MAKKRITRADFIGLRMIRPETGMNGQPMQRSARHLTEEEYYYYYNKEDYYTYLYYLYMNPYYYGDDWHDNPDDPYWWGEGNPYGNPYGNLYYWFQDAQEKAGILNENWACVFNCMTFLNPSLSAWEYYKEYMASGPSKDPSRIGGLEDAVLINALQTCGFMVEETNRFSGAHTERYIGIFQNLDSAFNHAVLLIDRQESKNGYVYTVYDPSTGNWDNEKKETDLVKILKILN